MTDAGPALDTARTALRRLTRADEADCVAALLAETDLPPAQRDAIRARATDLVTGVRGARRKFGNLDDFLEEYSLSTPEGVALMCIAEALLRIPDAATADALIDDKFGTADWHSHLGESDSLFVNASTWALMLTGGVVHVDEDAGADPLGFLKTLTARLGEPVIRQAMRQAMRVMGRQFVIGRTIEDALAAAHRNAAYLHSFDMLGEGARTGADAARYFEAYLDAAKKIADDAASSDGAGGPAHAHGMSVKLSALHPRYEYAQKDRCVPEIAERLVAIAQVARDGGIGLTVDAEEADRLDLFLDIVERAARAPALADWDGFGVAVQAYQKRCPALIDWLAALAIETRRHLMVRLVKGAYWDTEIKRAQERGLDGYPVYTRKTATDVAYLACARRLFAQRGVLFGQFATHNAHTVAALLELMPAEMRAARDFEFQRLYGMGEPLYHQLVGPDTEDLPVRIYAPVGKHQDLLPYLVRRLLENGANTSFVNRARDDALPVAEIVADPMATLAAFDDKPHPKIVLPADLYAGAGVNARRNSAGYDIGDPAVVTTLLSGLADHAAIQHEAAPIVGGAALAGPTRPLTDPADRRRELGTVIEASGAQAEAAIDAAAASFEDWDHTPADARAGILERVADLFQRDAVPLMALAVREAGKTIPDAIAEVREAIDFCRYYAARARADFATPQSFVGPTGERNEMSLHGRGVFACISPWNFPLAIFTGQVAAALAAGNAVVAKPAEQTPLIAAAAVRLMHEAGVPPGALALLPGDGTVGAALTADPRLAGVAFTGSVEAAHAINRALAASDGPIATLIAETGGQNAMIADASALPEQLVDDAIASGFRSAGQRCSALRVLFLQDDTADKVVEMLCGAARELVVGEPMDLATDVGPVIDDEARRGLEEHINAVANYGKVLLELPLDARHTAGTFFAPRVVEIDALDRLTHEVFGPVIHVVRYAADKLDAVIDAVNAAGYGLTLGVHSRIETTQAKILARVRAGNAYVNRTMIGSVVGVQPFGGEGLSGTGPKAGGPHYLPRFAVERARSINTAAAGGNTSLLMLGDEGA